MNGFFQIFTYAILLSIGSAANAGILHDNAFSLNLVHVETEGEDFDGVQCFVYVPSLERGKVYRFYSVPGDDLCNAGNTELPFELVEIDDEGYVQCLFTKKRSLFRAKGTESDPAYAIVITDHSGVNTLFADWFAPMAKVVPLPSGETLIIAFSCKEHGAYFARICSPEAKPLVGTFELYDGEDIVSTDEIILDNDIFSELHFQLAPPKKAERYMAKICIGSETVEYPLPKHG